MKNYEELSERRDKWKSTILFVSGYEFFYGLVGDINSAFMISNLIIFSKAPPLVVDIASQCNLRI